MQYTAEYFTAEHMALLGDMQVEEYHRIAEKYTTTKQLETIDVSSATLNKDMKSALLAKTSANMVMVSGVMHTTSDGVMEKWEEYETLVRCVKKVISDLSVIITADDSNKMTVVKYYIHILGPHKTPYPHPKLLKMLENGTYKLTNNSGLWAPGQPMPEETIIAEVMTGERGVKLTTGLMCSVLSNFNTIRTVNLDPRTIGCNPDKVPKEAMDVDIVSAEHAIQFAKAVAVLAFPAKFMKLDADDAVVTKTIEAVGKIAAAGAGSTDVDAVTTRTTTLKRKLLTDKEQAITAICNEIYVRLSVEDDFDAQKKLGQLPILKDEWFAVVKGTPIDKYSNFNAEDLGHLGANSIMQAAVIMLRVLGGDSTLYARLRFDLEMNNTPVEAAMHGPVKAVSKTNNSKYLFSGCFPDRVWGSLNGCPRYVDAIDMLVHKDAQPQVGHLGNGASIVRQAIRGDKDVLAFLGLKKKLTLDNMQEGAAKAFDKFWVVVRGGE